MQSFTKTTLLSLVMTWTSVSGRPSITLPQRFQHSANAGATAEPKLAYCAGYHNIGNIGMCVTNYGWIGSDQSFSYFVKPPDRPCRIGFIPGFSDTLGAFPRGSHTFYMYEGAIWVGAVVEGDTLVSTGWGQGSAMQFEFRPDAPPNGEIRHLSN